MTFAHHAERLEHGGAPSGALSIQAYSRGCRQRAADAAEDRDSVTQDTQPAAAPE
jgi:hypothetical protein